MNWNMKGLLEKITLSEKKLLVFIILKNRILLNVCRKASVFQEQSHSAQIRLYLIKVVKDERQDKETQPTSD